MKCEDARNNIYFYVTGEIKPEERAEIEGHIGTCAECRKTLGEFRAALDAVNANMKALPEKNWNYLAEKTLEKIYAFKPYRFLKTAAMVSMALLVFAVGYYRYNTGKSDGVMTKAEADELAYYLTDFEIPELYQ